MLTSFNWDWWVSLTSRKPMPLKVIRGRFFWWLKCLRKVIGRKPEFVWIIERQRRGALHIHAVISGIPSNNSSILWRGMINTWEYYNSKGGIRFGDATIKKFNPQKAGKLCWYLAKERCKDLDLLEGSGSVFEKMGYSRGVKQFLNTPSMLKKLIWGVPISGPTSDSSCRLNV